MIKYYGMLYAKMGRKYIPTGRTAADWDLMESAIKPQSSIVCRLENARLIAAAPDLLAALKAWLACHDGAGSTPPDEAYVEPVRSILKNARAALAKAEGVK